MKSRKGRKISNRIRKVQDRTLFNLLNNLPYQCQSCIYNANCPNIRNMNDTSDCDNYEITIELNDLIKMLNEQNVNISSFAKKYDLKYEYLMQMLKGKMLLNYKYYWFLCKRLHIEGFCEFDKYKSRFENNEIEFENNEINIENNKNTPNDEINKEVKS